MQCPACEALFSLLSQATNEYFRAVGRLKLARLRRDREVIDLWERTVAEASAAREQARAAFRAHRMAQGHAATEDAPAEVTA